MDELQRDRSGLPRDGETRDSDSSSDDAAERESAAWDTDVAPGESLVAVDASDDVAADNDQSVDIEAGRVSLSLESLGVEPTRDAPSERSSHELTWPKSSRR